MKTKKLLLLVFTLLCITCLVFAACEPQMNSNSISGLKDISLHCGEALPEITATAEYGDVSLSIAAEEDGVEKESLPYVTFDYMGRLTAGTYYIKASVPQGLEYEAAVAFAKVTVTHYSFDEIEGAGSNHQELNGNQFHTWSTKQCACGEFIIGNDKTVELETTAITGLDEVLTSACGSTLDLSGVTTSHGTLEFCWADPLTEYPIDMQNYNQLTADKVFNVGKYYIRASVAQGETYTPASAYATLYVSHQAFEDIAGKGEFHDEVTSDNKYHSWYEKTCACGAVVKGNEQTVDKLQNAVTGLADINLTCGSTLNISGIGATYGTVKVEYANALEGYEKEDLGYVAISGALNQGVYYLRATVEEGKTYLGVVAYAKVTVDHQSYDEIEKVGTFKFETTADGKYHTWYEKTCACGKATIKGGDQTVDKKPTEITGLSGSLSFVCNQDFVINDVGSTNGTVVLEVATAVEGTAKEDLDYKPLTGTEKAVYGTYYVRASVAEGDDYAAQSIIVKVVVNHHAFENISGDGEFKSEITADDKYHSWTEKACVCGETVIGNDTTVDRLENAVTGLADASVVCGSTLDVSAIGATYGTVKIEIAKAVEGTEKEKLTYAAISGALNHGTYYVRVTVAEAHSYYGVVAYAQVTVNHKAYADIAGDATHVAPANNVNGYDYKTCACGEQIKGETEYVLVTIKVDGEVVDSQDLAIGAKVTVPAESKLPAREGYVLIVLDSENEQWKAGETASAFATIELKAYWVKSTEYSISKVNTNWIFIANDDTGLTKETVNTLTEDKDNKLWVVETLFNKDKPSSPAELTLGNIKFEIGRTYTLTLKSEHATFVTFGTATWDKNAYLIGEDDVNKDIIITITYTGKVTIVTYNDDASVYTEEEWSTHNLNGQNLCIQYKPQDTSASSERFKVYISDVVVEYWDYAAEEATLVATLPEASAIDADNVDDVEATLKQIVKLRKEFSDYQLKNAVDITAHQTAVTTLLADHLFNLQKIAKDLPAFSTMWTANKDSQDAAFQTLTKYLAYYNLKFTAEEKATYQEPKEIAFYREFFADRKYATENASADMSGFSFWDNKPEKQKFNPNNQNGTLALPKIAYGAYSQVSFYLDGSCTSAPVTFKINGTTFTYTQPVYTKDNEGKDVLTSGTTYMKVKFVVEKKDDGWYVTVTHNEQSDVTTSFKLDDSVVLGNSALTVDVETSAWSLVFINADGETIDGLLDKISASLDTTGATTVHQVVYTYETTAGTKMLTQYYLDGEELVLPTTVPASYENEVGTYTFAGWFASETEYKADHKVTGDLYLKANYTVEYTEYEVAYIEGNSDWCDPQIYTYGKELVLPTEEPTREGGSGFHWEFKGWFDESGKQYFGGEKITCDLELYAKMESVPDGLPEYDVKLTNLGGADQTKTYRQGETLADLEAPVRSGYVFEGWYLNGTKYDTTSSVTDDIILVAKWLVPVKKTEVVDGAPIFNGDSAAVTDESWKDSNGNAFTKFWTIKDSSADENAKDVYAGDNAWIKLPMSIFKTYSTLEMFVETGSNVFSLTLDGEKMRPGDPVSKDLGAGANTMFLVRFYKENNSWKVIADNNTNCIGDVSQFLDIDGATTLYLHVWNNSSPRIDVKVSNVIGYLDENCDYIARATLAAEAIGDLASDADTDTKIAALQTYRSWRNHFTSYELASIAVPEAVTTLERELTEWTNIWTPTDSNYDDVICSSPDADQIISSKSHIDLKATYEANPSGDLQGYMWKKDKDGNQFSVANQYEPNNIDNSQRRSATFTLPAIDFTQYAEVRFMVHVASAENSSFTLSIKDEKTSENQTVGTQTEGQTYTCYIVYVKAVDGAMTFEICYDRSSDVKASGTLSSKVASGQEGLQFTVTVEAWSFVQISEIHGLRGLTKTIWTPTADNVKDVKCDAVLWTASDRYGNGKLSGKVDKDGQEYTLENHYQPNAGNESTGERTVKLTLPTLDYALYSEAKFCVYVQNTTGKAVKFGIDDKFTSNAPYNTSTSEEGVVTNSTIVTYYVYVTTVNGVSTANVYAENSTTPALTVDLSATVAQGQEGLTFSLFLDGWTLVSISEVYGIL